MYNYINISDDSIASVHTKAQKQFPIVDRILEPQTIPTHFIPFAFGNPLADGSWPRSARTDASLLAGDELELIQANFPPGSSEPSILERIMSRIGSNEDGKRLCLVGKNIHALKSRLWEGITPMSDQRWREKGLDHPENLTSAIQHLSAVIAVFAYLNDETVQKNLRDTYNLIYDHWESMDAVINERRAKDGKLGPVNLANLWAVYMTFHFKMMSQRAHQWVVEHVEALRTPLLEKLLAYKSPTGEEKKPDQVHLELTNAMQLFMEVTVRADYTIMIPMEGYKGYAPAEGEETRTGPPQIYDADISRRGPSYAGRLKVITHKMLVDKYADANFKPKTQSLGQSYHEMGTNQIVAQKQIQRELRGNTLDLKIPEPWISALQREDGVEPTKEYSITIYRLTYGQSDSEWAEFVAKLENHMSNWGEGQIDSDSIKHKLKLKWVDGNGFGFAEDDIAAAKTHFKQNPADQISDIPGGWFSDVFLAVDSASYDSYTTDKYRPEKTVYHAGDLGGFVLAVDSNYDPVEGIERPDESPGYAGQLRVLGNLVWGDVYPLLMCQSTGLEGLWPLATNHPHQVYYGPTLPLTVEWKFWGVVRLLVVLIIILVILVLLVKYLFLGLRGIWRWIF